MGFHVLLQCMNVLCMIWLGSFLQKVQSIPVSSSEVIPGVRNSSALLEYFKYSGDRNRELKSIDLLNVSDEFEKSTSETTVISARDATKKSLVKKSFSTVLVPYLCDIQKEMCWLNQNRENLVTFLIPIKLLPNKLPPSEIGLKEFYSLMYNKKKQPIDNFDPTNSNSTKQEQNASSKVHPRRKRDTRYSENNYNPQHPWANQGGYEVDQSARVQRNILNTSTEEVPTSTEGRIQSTADVQAGKQSKRSTETDDDEEENDDFGTLSPDDDYPEDNGMDYHPEKRFADSHTTGATPKPGDSASKNPSQLSRRAAMKSNFNYPYFANPDFYYPSRRMLSPFDGIGYRSVDAFPMMYMDPNAVFWQTKFARSPQQYYQQRQPQGYGRGWPPYYQQFANRYSATYPTPGQQNRGHYHTQYAPQQSYRPYSYSYAQGNNNYKPPVRKPIETDANMYYAE